MSAGKYTGGFNGGRRLCCALALAAASVAPAPPAIGVWRAAPEYVRLFTPAQPAGAYEAFVSPDPLEALLPRLDADPDLLRPPGAWVPQATIALDAFGGSGGYNRWTLARLYGARRPNVARGPRGSGGRVSESWTLISPYPDPALRRLEAGTLLIVVRIP